MNKLELIKRLKETHKLTMHQAAEVVDLFFREATAALARGERVEIRGMGSISVKEYKPYIGRNPRSGEPVPVTAKRLPFFKCGLNLNRRVNTEG